MSEESKWRMILVTICAAMAVVCYTLDYVLFRDAETIFQFLIEETGFVFISVILVSLVIDKILDSREHSNRMQKLNMVIGTFFSEVGTDLIKRIADFDANCHRLVRELQVTTAWTSEDFKRVSQVVRDHPAEISVPEGDLGVLKMTLKENRYFLLNLLQNPNLLENESFTDLLWALFHLAEELINREDIDHLSKADKTHISGDIGRAYKALVCEWLSYMKHLKDNYPFLFSFAMRTNPFDSAARIEFCDCPEPQAGQSAPAASS